MLYCLEMISVKDNKVYDSRIFGVFTKRKLNDLRNIIINNITDLWEFYYKYAIIYTIPENVLYCDCYESFFEAYKVSLPKEYLEAKEKGFSHKECDDIIKEKWNEVKYIKKKKEEVPEYSLKRYTGDKF